VKGRFGFSIDLPVRNDWRNVDLMRSSIQSCFTAVFRDLDGCHAMSMVTGELLENAMKYGHWGESEQVFRLRLQSSMGQGEAGNKIRPLRKELARLRTVLREKDKKD
jgi:hypothetical protein